MVLFLGANIFAANLLENSHETSTVKPQTLRATKLKGFIL